MLRSGHTTRKTLWPWLGAPNHIQLMRGVVEALSQSYFVLPVTCLRTGGECRSIARDVRSAQLRSTPAGHASRNHAVPCSSDATARQRHHRAPRHPATRMLPSSGDPAAGRPLKTRHPTARTVHARGHQHALHVSDRMERSSGSPPRMLVLLPRPRQSGTQRRAIADSPAGRRVARLAPGPQGC